VQRRGGRRRRNRQRPCQLPQRRAGSWGVSDVSRNGQRVSGGGEFHRERPGLYSPKRFGGLSASMCDSRPSMDFLHLTSRHSHPCACCGLCCPCLDLCMCALRFNTDKRREEGAHREGFRLPRGRFFQAHRGSDPERAHNINGHPRPGMKSGKARSLVVLGGMGRGQERGSHGCRERETEKGGALCATSTA